jgi:hypothetical protein
MSVHIINPYFNSDIKSSIRQLNAINQIERFRSDTNVIYYSKEDDYVNNKPVIPLMLEEAAKDCNLDDFIISTNSDCIPNKTLYSNLENLDINIIYLLS